MKLSYGSERRQVNPLDEVYVYRDDKSTPYLLQESEVSELPDNEQLILLIGFAVLSSMKRVSVCSSLNRLN